MNDVNRASEVTYSDIQDRHGLEGSQSEVLSNISQPEINIVIWKRNLSNSLVQAADSILDAQPNLEKWMICSPQDTCATIQQVIGPLHAVEVLSQDIARLVDIFCELFNQERVSLKLSSLDHAMCPRFHVDRVPCRMITTYQGVATQWLPHDVADRSKLGTGNQGKPDELSGLFENASDIKQLNCGDVALLKGEIWDKNQGAGLIHRSPKLPNNLRRLLLTIDFIND